MTGSTSTTRTVSPTWTSSDTTTSEMITTTTASPTTTTAIETSAFFTLLGPAQRGISSSCNLYAEPISGDGCYDFAIRYGLTIDQFCKPSVQFSLELAGTNEWNPAVGECVNFWAGEAYCVGVAS
ncbi:putative chitinase [Seiridium unicorne]|uniref:Chitinase n=1 Tax=Seiridium unicorne TaxID=138068 RepID=A0ABR2UW74_9PEZI